MGIDYSVKNVFHNCFLKFYLNKFGVCILRIIFKDLKFYSIIVIPLSRGYARQIKSQSLWGDNERLAGVNKEVP